MNPHLLPGALFSRLFRVAAVVSLLQLSVIFIYMLVVGLLGPRVTRAEDFYLIQASQGWLSLLRVDLLMMLLVSLYLGNMPAIGIALWRKSPLIVALSLLLTLIAVVLSMAGESSFALFHLAKLYAGASSDLQRSTLVAAGDAVLAAGWWNSTGSYMTGILLQGSGVMLCLVMLKSSSFSRMTAWAGLLGNAFDLLQHLVSPFAPHLAAYLSFIMVAYLLWYPLLARDLFRLAHQPETD